MVSVGDFTDTHRNQLYLDCLFSLNFLSLRYTNGRCSTENILYG